MNREEILREQVAAGKEAEKELHVLENLQDTINATEVRLEELTKQKVIEIRYMTKESGIYNIIEIETEAETIMTDTYLQNILNDKKRRLEKKLEEERSFKKIFNTEGK